MALTPFVRGQIGAVPPTVEERKPTAELLRRSARPSKSSYQSTSRRVAATT